MTDRGANVHFPTLRPIPLRRAIFSLKDSKNHLPGAPKQPQPYSTAGLVGQKAVSESQPQQPSPEPPPDPSS